MNTERQKLKIKKNDDTTENKLNRQRVKISFQDWHRGEVEDLIKEGDRRKIKAEEFKKYQVQVWCGSKHQVMKKKSYQHRKGKVEKQQYS